MAYTNKPQIRILNPENTEIVFITNSDIPIHECYVDKSILSNRSNFKAELEIEIIFLDKMKFEDGFNLDSFDELNFIDDCVKHHIHKGIMKITIRLSNIRTNEFEIPIIFVQGHKLFDLKNPLKEFEEHISNFNNSKILFSAPFGHGKTTFLNHFFDEKVSAYEVFKVFPVNYSVSENADIFRYIKADILFQLLGKNVEFDIENFTTKEKLKNFFYINSEKAIPLLLKTILALNIEVESLPEILKILNDIFEKFRSEPEVLNDEVKTKRFIKQLYENEGSIFEDNFYTQLIRQQLEKLKIESKKENVLIIEDLDRMDPDHIFRILNVISAHYDTYHLGADFPYTNKFGFDKIIVVCHLNNIKSIFEHRYGRQTDFNGYFDKYFSSKPFEYNNAEMIASLSNEFLKDNMGLSGKGSDFTFYLNFIELLVRKQLLSLRELIKIKKHTFEREVLNSHSIIRIDDGIAYHVIYNLLKIFDINVIVNKLENLKSTQNIPQSFKTEHWANQLLYPFGKMDNSNKEIYIIEDTSHPYFIYSYRVNSYDRFPVVIEVKKQQQHVKLNFDDFLKLMTYHIDNYFK